MVNRKACLLPILLLIVLSFAGACRGSHPEARAEMDIADSLMDTRPDSALKILDSVDCIPRLTESDRMRSDLLRVKANDRRYVKPESDTTIKALLEYYIDEGHDRQLHPTVLYYAGRTYSELGQPSLGLRYFRQALDISNKENDLDLQSRIHSQMAGIFINHYAYDSALVHVKSQIACEKEAGDTLNINSYLLLAFTYRALEMTDSAEQIYKSLAPVVFGKGDSITETVFITQAAAFLKDTGRFPKADSLMHCRSLNPDRASEVSVSIILNEFDERKLNYADLEDRCLQMTVSDNIYSRRSAYRNLSKIYQTKGDVKKSLEYVEKYRAVADTISANMTPRLLKGIVEYPEHSNIGEGDENNTLLWIALIFGFLIVAAVYILSRIKRGKQPDPAVFEHGNTGKEQEKASLDVESQNIIQDFNNKIATGSRISEADFKSLKRALANLYPEFMCGLLKLNLDSRAFKDSMLIKIGVSQKDCAEIFHRTPSAISNSRTRLLKKLGLDKDFRTYPDFISSL